MARTRETHREEDAPESVSRARNLLEEQQKELGARLDALLTQIPADTPWEQHQLGIAIPAFEPIKEEFARLSAESLRIGEKIRSLPAQAERSHAERTTEETAALITKELGYPTTLMTRGGKTFIVCDAPDEDMGDLLGVAYPDIGIAVMRQNLPGAVYRWVREHEVAHLLDKKFFATYNGPAKWLLEEIRASLHGLYDPYGMIACFVHSWKNPRRKKRSLLSLLLKGQLFQQRPAEVQTMAWPLAEDKIRSLLHY